MCIVSSPKPQTTKEKDPAIIRNPYLDGLDPQTKALRTGRSSLRIERTGAGGTQTSAPVADSVATPAPAAAAPAATPAPTSRFAEAVRKAVAARNAVLLKITK